MNFKNFNSKFLFIFISLFLFDQITKHFIKNVMFTKNIGFFKTTNTGASFSILEGYTFFLIVISIIFIIGLMYYLINYKIDYPILYSFILILSGAIGNLFDRFLFGHVFDFIKIYWWPIFNFADIYLSIGVILLFYFEFKK